LASSTYSASRPSNAPRTIALVALCLTGCAGTKFNLAYDFNAKKFFAEIEQPLSGYKK
jgi:hypothetical protein